MFLKILNSFIYKKKLFMYKKYLFILFLFKSKDFNLFKGDI